MHKNRLSSINSRRNRCVDELLPYKLENTTFPNGAIKCIVQIRNPDASRSDCGLSSISCR